MIEVTLFQIVILIFSVVVHEVSHGMIAYKLGDQTAKLQGRLTLNPLKHLDPIGSFIVPLVLILLPGDFVFGWAKPVPINSYNFRNPRLGNLLVSLAGPLSNFIFAWLLAILTRYLADGTILILLEYTIWINLALAVFNLLPIPPLDGSHILEYFLAPYQLEWMYRLQQYGFIILIAFMMFGFPILSAVVEYLYRLIT